MEPHTHDEAAELTFREWLEGNLPESSSAEPELLQSSFFTSGIATSPDQAVLPNGGKVHQIAGLLDPATYGKGGDLPLDESLRPVAAEETVEMLQNFEMEYSYDRYSRKPGVDEVIGLATLDQISFNEVYEKEFPGSPDCPQPWRNR